MLGSYMFNQTSMLLVVRLLWPLNEQQKKKKKKKIVQNCLIIYIITYDINKGKFHYFFRGMLVWYCCVVGSFCCPVQGISVWSFFCFPPLFSFFLLI